MIMKIPWMMVTLGFKSLNAIVRQRSLDRGPPLLCPTSLCLQAAVCWAAAEPISWSRPSLSSGPRNLDKISRIKNLTMSSSSPSRPARFQQRWTRHKRNWHIWHKTPDLGAATFTSRPPQSSVYVYCGMESIKLMPLIFLSDSLVFKSRLRVLNGPPSAQYCAMDPAIQSSDGAN